MATATKTPRLLAAAKEFNIGKETLVEFLTNKGFEINASNPNTKLTEVMYDALQAEFAQDKLAKRKSDEIALPKGSLLDNLKKSKEELDLTVRDKKGDEPEVVPAPAPEKKKEEKAPVVEVKAPVEEVKPQPVAVAPQVEEPVAPVKEPAPAPRQEVKQPQAEKQPEVEKTPVAETPKAVEPKPKVEEPAQPVKEEAPVAPKEQPAAPVAENNNNTDTEDTQHIDVKAPKLEGPNILGKINLDELNLSSRPKKGAAATQQPQAKKKATPAPKEEKPEAPAAQPQAEVKKEEPPVQKEPAKPAPQPERKPEPAPVAETREPAAPQQEEEQSRPEHIEMKAPRLEGPKIIGKIELPVANSGGSKSNDRNNEKRNRKRIPVQKKPETFQPGQGGGQGQQGGNRDRNQQGGGPGGNRDNNNRSGDNRNNNNQRGPGGNNNDRRGPGGNNNDRRGPGGNNNDRRGPGGNNDRRGPGQRHGQDNRNNNAAPQEIDEKQIQRKIQETQAKLAGGGARGKNQKSKYRRDKRELMAEKRAAAENAEQNNVIQVTEFISVSELANLLDVSFADVISKCMNLGIMVSINQRLDAEVIELVANEFGYEVEFINLQQESDMVEEDEVDEGEQIPRAPIVTIMGHVDHGKTSLLDYIRSANVVAGEAGGITQHIGAYQVTTANGKKITFLDTPGHEAFTAMRARGAKVADVAVIVVAADDAIMPQTKEAISHAQAAGLPMIFAINKIDKEGANPEKIKEQLAQLNILVEDWGGKYQSQEISAKKGLNIDLLLEKIGLEAELLELKANPDRIASGSVIEASLDKGRGYQATILVQNGTLKQGDMIACGQHFGKVKAMFNERGQRVTTAGPSAPVQVLGLNGAPQAGEKFKVYEDENEAKDVANHRAQIMREQGIRARKHLTLDEIGRRLALGNFKELPIIIKGDFDGSVEALSDSLQKLSTEEVAVNVVHKAVGQITESDVLLATASDAIILGFQVRPSMQAARLAEQENIEIRNYSIIYDAIEEIKSAMEGLLEPKVEKKTVSNIEVREIYKIGGVGTIAGCYVLDGKMSRNTKLNLVRDGIVIYTGELSSLKRYKDDVKEVSAGYECGLMIKNYNDVRIGDIIEGFEEVEVKRTL
ncbi:translation initiation factor IF-2 [Chitinophagaceae bacterium MMS25-I14]